MSASLARLFASLFNAIVLLLVLAVIGGAGLYYTAGGSALVAVVLAFAGLAGVVALFGAVALQIENNELLHRIAAALEQRAPQADPVAGLAATMAAGRQLPPRAAAATAAEPLLRPATPAAAAPVPGRLVAEARRPATPPGRGAAPQGRVEPVLRSR